MTRINLNLLFIHLLKRVWKNRMVKKYIFRKSYLNFTFAQDNCRKSDFVKPNSSKAVLVEISKIGDSHI